MRLNSITILFIFLSIYLSSFTLATTTTRTNSNNYIGFNKVTEIFKPVQLVYPDDEMSVLGVVGTFHSGKSFLLNQLIGTTDKFTVGPTVHPQTLGIWMWSSKIQYEGKSYNLLLLDTEGFFSSNVSETYDAKIFAITTLLSSHLIYNSVKIIDQSALEYLELLSRRTQLFALKTQIKSSETFDSALNQILKFPSLTWVVQDFFQDIEKWTPTEWLHNLLKSHSRDSMESSLSITEIFPSIECHTLFIPSGDKTTLRHLDQARIEDLNPTYLKELALLKDSLFNSLKPKLTGPAFGSLLKLLVEVANGNKFPTVPSIWAGFIKEQQQNALEDCIAAYKEKMNIVKTSQPPLNEEDFMQLQKTTYDYVNDLYKQLLFGLYEAYTPGLIMLQNNLLDLADYYRKENYHLIKSFCQNIYSEIIRSFQKNIDSIATPTGSKILMSLVGNYQMDSINQYKSDLKSYSKSDSFSFFFSNLENELERIISVKQLHNKNEHETLLTKSVSVVSERYKAAMYNLNYPLSFQQLIKENMEQKRICEESFKKITEVSRDEISYPAYLASFEKSIATLFDTFQEYNDNKILELSKKQSHTSIYDFKKGASQILLPVEEEYLLEHLDTIRAKCLESFKESMTLFHHSKSYTNELRSLDDSIKKQIDFRLKENVEQMKLIVMETLNTVKTIMKSQAASYWFQHSFIKEAKREAEYRIKSKIESKSLREKVINQFVETDLKDEVEMLWSNKTIIGAVIIIFLVGITLSKTRSTGGEINNISRPPSTPKRF
eukprot:gene986-1252_t